VTRAALDPEDSPDLRALEDRTVREEVLDHRVTPASQDSEVRPDSLEDLELKEPRVSQASRVT